MSPYLLRLKFKMDFETFLSEKILQRRKRKKKKERTEGRFQTEKKRKYLRYMCYVTTEMSLSSNYG